MKSLFHAMAKTDKKALGTNHSLLIEKLFEPSVGLSEEPAKKNIGAWLDSIVDVGLNMESRDLYERAVQKRCMLFNEQSQFEVFSLRLLGRLYIGTRSNALLEAGVTCDPVYGLPIIPGSSLKGILRARLLSLGASTSQVDILLGGVESANSVAQASAASIFDAMWVRSQNTSNPFVKEIITPHAAQYLASDETKSVDINPFKSEEPPVPAQQLACQGAFLFAVQCAEPGWLTFVKEQLQLALCETGVGAKTAVGYGLFDHESLNEERDEMLKVVESEKPQKAQVLPVLYSANKFFVNLPDGRLAESSPSQVEALCNKLKEANPELFGKLKKRGSSGKKVPLQVTVVEAGKNVFIDTLNWDVTSSEGGAS